MYILLGKEHFCNLHTSRRPSFQLQGYKTHTVEEEMGTLKD